MKPRGIDFFVYNVSDIERSADFYEHTLGLSRMSWDAPGWVEFSIGSTQTVLALRFDPDDAGAEAPFRSGAVAIAVDDVEQTVAQLRTRGVDVVLNPGEQASCFAAGITDPDGNLVLLHSRKDGTAG